VAAPSDSVFAILRSPEGGVLGARLSGDDDGGPWFLPAGPVGAAGVRTSLEGWCRQVIGRPVTVGHLVSVRFRRSAAEPSLFGFEISVPDDCPTEFTAHGGALLCRFLPPEELSELLAPVERGVLWASLSGIEGASVMEWNAEGEFSDKRSSPWTRMMPSLPHPFGPLPLVDEARATRNRAVKRR
jgi:hypothetical protein